VTTVELVEVIMSAITLISSLLGLSAALALLLAAERREVSWRTGYAAVMAGLCIWCLARSLHGESTPLELIGMLLLAAQALRSLAGRKTINTIRDVLPFK
jgi:hypothetical protein